MFSFHIKQWLHPYRYHAGLLQRCRNEIYKFASSFDVGNQTYRYECVSSSTSLNAFPWIWISPLFLVLLLRYSLMAAAMAAMGCYKMRRTQVLRGLDQQQLHSAEGRLSFIENNFKGAMILASLSSHVSALGILMAISDPLIILNQNGYLQAANMIALQDIGLRTMETDESACEEAYLSLKAIVLSDLSDKESAQDNVAIVIEGKSERSEHEPNSASHVRQLHLADLFQYADGSPVLISPFFTHGTPSTPETDSGSRSSGGTASGPMPSRPPTLHRRHSPQRRGHLHRGPLTTTPRWL